MTGWSRWTSDRRAHAQLGDYVQIKTDHGEIVEGFAMEAETNSVRVPSANLENAGTFSIIEWRFWTGPEEPTKYENPTKR